MKHLKHLNEMTVDGEPSNLTDLLDMTDNERGRSDRASWMYSFYEALIQMKDFVDGDFGINDINWFDQYQGPYAFVTFGHKKYKVWTQENNELYFEKFPNTEHGYKGEIEEIADLINDYLRTNRGSISAKDTGII